MSFVRVKNLHKRSKANLYIIINTTSKFKRIADSYKSFRIKLEFTTMANSILYLFPESE